MPFGGFKDFDACVLEMRGKGHSDEEARAMCGRLQADAEGEHMADFDNQWFEIFRAGDYGDKGKYTAAELDQMVSNFEHWKPPLVLGHPQNDSPAMGWAAELKRDGDRLLARAENVQPQLEEHVSSGRFPNRSIAIYANPKGSGPAVRHIGFLGATPPEVKGLEPVKFSDGEFVAIDLTFKEEEEMDQNEVKKTVAAEIRSFFSSLFGEKKPEGSSFTEEQMQQRIEAANKPILAAMAALSAKFDESVKKTAEQSAAATAEARRANVVAFIEKRKAVNQWVPAFSEAGLDKVLEQLATSGGTVKFGEAGKEKDVSAYELLCKFFEALPQIVPTRELAKGAKRAGKNVIQFTEARGIELDLNSVTVNARAEEIAGELRKQDPKLTESQAFSEALRTAYRELHAGGAAAVSV